MDVPDLLAPGSGLGARELAIAPGAVAIVAEPTSSVAECPACGAPSEHVHGRYTRTVADLPWQGRRVVLRLAVRRFQCRNAACLRRTFIERLPTVAPYAQTTHVQKDILGCEQYVWPGGHLLYLVDPEGFVKVMLETLEKLETRS